MFELERALIHSKPIQLVYVYVMLWAICYHLYNLKNAHGGMLLLVKLHAETCNLSKSNTAPCFVLLFFFSSFLNCTNDSKLPKASHTVILLILHATKTRNCLLSSSEDYTLHIGMFCSKLMRRRYSVNQLEDSLISGVLMSSFLENSIFSL